MLEDFNLLATTYRGFERKACFELKYLLEQIGSSGSDVRRCSIAGLIVAKAVSDSYEVVKKLRDILQSRPYEFRYILRLIPVEKVVHTRLSEIIDATENIGVKIGETETFRITVEKRFTTMHSRDIIEAVAAKIKRKVDLNKPDKILLIEIVGGLTGVSLIDPNGILSVLKEKIL